MRLLFKRAETGAVLYEHDVTELDALLFSHHEFSVIFSVITEGSTEAESGLIYFEDSEGAIVEDVRDNIHKVKTWVFLVPSGFKQISIKVGDVFTYRYNVIENKGEILQ